MRMNTSETKNEIKERMYAVIELVESKESAQIAVNQNYFNKYVDKLSNLICEGNMIMHLKGWYDKLREELYMLKNGIIANSDIITKFNNCFE